jgi:hypothetical protein
MKNEKIFQLEKETKMSPDELKTEINIGLEWLRKHVWLGGVMAIFIPATWWYLYVIREGVPGSVASSSMITALPTLMALVIFLEIICIGMLLSPAALLLLPMKKGEESWMSRFVRQQKDGSSKLAQGSLFLTWTGTLAIPIIFLELVIWFLAKKVNTSQISDQVSMLVAILSIILLFLLILGVLGSGSIMERFKATTVEILGAVLFGTTMQLLLIGIIMTYAIRVVSLYFNSESFPLWILTSVVIAFCVGLIQLVGAKIVVELRGLSKPVQSAALFGTTLLFLVSIFPYAGPSLARTVFQSTASGGRSCVILTMAPSAKSNFTDLKTKPDDVDSKSKELVILLDIDGMYQVRLKDRAKDDDTVYSIPKDNVIAMSSCPKGVQTTAQ